MNHPSTTSRGLFAAARQRGYSILEMTLAIGSVAVIGVIVFLAFSDSQSSLNQTRALSEINGVASSARQYRSSFAHGGLYTDINMEELAEYNLAGMNVRLTGAASRGVNAYGLDVNVVASGTPSGTDATVTYTFPGLDECSEAMELFTDAAGGTTASTATNEHATGFKAGVVCSTAGALTLIIE